MSITPERHLWQSVLIMAVTDATYVGDVQDLRREKRTADRWLRGCGRDFRRVCTLAGMDPDFVSEAYAGGRINGELLRSAQGRHTEVAQ